MDTNKDIIKNLVSMGYLPPGTHLKSASRRNPSRFIKTALSNAWCNMMIKNVPTRSVPRDHLRPEEITPQHIFETLCEFGDTRHVIQVTPSCYMAYATDAEEIAAQLNGNTIEGQVIEVTYTEMANPLEVRTAEMTAARNSWSFADLRVVASFVFLAVIVTNIYASIF